MKKLLCTLLCLPLIFSSCQEDDPSPSAPPSSNALCGSATLTIGSTNYTYNNPYIMPDGTCQIISSVIKVNGELKGISISLNNFYADNIYVEWSLNASLQNSQNSTIEINHLYTYNSNALANYINGMIAGTFPANTNSPDQQVMNTSSGTSNGEMKITNIDYGNNTIDGELSFTGYPVLSGSTQQVSCTFSDIPFYLTEM